MFKKVCFSDPACVASYNTCSHFSDLILAAGFSNLYYDKTLASMDMTASSSITTIEKLFKGEQVIVQYWGMVLALGGYFLQCIKRLLKTRLGFLRKMSE